MTVKELSQLYYLNKEIESYKKRLDELEASISVPHSPSMDAMPRASGSGKALEDSVAEIVDLKALIAAKQIQCIHERNRLERYISSIPDSLTRQIFALRFINGLPWRQVAYSVGGGTTEDSVKKMCYRYMRRDGVEQE